MNKKYSFWLASTLLAAGLYAQKQSVSDSVYSIKEVVVTGEAATKTVTTKLSVPLRYLPLSVSSVSATALDLRGITNVQDAVRMVPGATIRSTYGAYQQLQVRGYDYMPIMVDGVRDERTSITNSAPISDLSSVESIELLKGPTSVLYGHSAVGGILNITRKQPSAERLLRGLVSYGSWNNRRAMLDVGGKVAGPVNFRTSVNWQKSKGYRNTNDRRFSGYAALSAKWGNHEADLRGGFNRDWYGTEMGLPPLMSNDIFRASDSTLFLKKGESLPNLNRKARYNNESDFMIHNGTNAMLRYAWQASPSLKIENRLAYNYDNIDYFSTEEMSYRTSTSAIYPYFYRSAKGTRTYIDVDSVQLTYPLRFAYTVHVINEQLEASGKLKIAPNVVYNYLAGYNFVSFTRDTYRGYGGGWKLEQLIDGPGLYSTISAYNPQSAGPMDSYLGAGTATRNYTHGVYAHNLFELGDKWRVMLSGRFDTFLFKTGTKRYAERSKERLDVTQMDGFKYAESKTTALTYRAGAVYLPNANTSLYASVANFFMPYRDIADTTTIIYIGSDGKRFTPADGNVFKPQTGFQVEMGGRYQVNNFIQASASVFYIRRNNEKRTLATKVTDTDNKQKNVVGVVGSTESQGFELELDIRPTNQWQINVGYSHTDAYIRKISPNAYLGKDAQEGVALNGVPKKTMFAMVRYAFDSGVLKNTNVFATGTYTDKIHRDMSRSLTYPSLFLMDMGIAHKLNKHMEVRMNVNNVLNRTYFNQSLGTQIFPGQPRNFLFTMVYSL